MITQIRSLAISLLALITFVAVGAKVAEGFESWECTCVNAECDWCAPTEKREWELYHTEAFIEYADEFTALFNSYETKWSKNNRLMMRAGNSGSFKFVKKGN